MASPSIRVREEVLSNLAGEPVGLMGNSPGEKPVLYLELRRKGETVNPLPWLASGDRKVSG